MDKQVDETAGVFKTRLSLIWLTGHSVARYVRSLAKVIPLTCSGALCFATLYSIQELAMAKNRQETRFLRRRAGPNDGRANRPTEKPMDRPYSP